MHQSFTDALVKWFLVNFPCLPIVLVLFLFTVLPEDWVQAFCTSAPHRAVVPCDSTSTAFLFRSWSKVDNICDMLTLGLTRRYLVVLVKAKFHYASWFGAGSKLDRAEI